MNPFAYLNPANIAKDAWNTAVAVFDPNVDLIPGVGIHEAKRNAKPNTPTNTIPTLSTIAKTYNGADDSGAYGGSSGGGSGSGTSAADLAYLDDLEARYRRQHTSADRALDSGLTSLQDSYNQEVSGVNKDRSRALEDFELKRTDTLRDKNSALGRVDNNARTLADSLRRRIGLASGSGSSAYQLAAPAAVARQASSDRGQLQEDYGVNFRNLGLAEDRAKSDFEELLEDLAAQRRSRESDFRAGILNQKNKIDTTLSEIARQRALAQGGGYDQVRQALSPFASSIDSRQNQIDSLFDRFRTPYKVNPVNVQTPQLRDYTVGQRQISPQAAQGDPYAEALNRRPFQEEDELNPLFR